MATESLRNVKDRFSEFVDRVEHQHERITVTRNGRPAVVLIAAADLESLEETIDVLSDPDALREIREARAEMAAGEVFTIDEVRAALAARVAAESDAIVGVDEVRAPPARRRRRPGVRA